MSPPDAPHGLVGAARPSERSRPDRLGSLACLLYTQNPFYILSVAFVLHSTRLWYRQSVGPFDPWPLMAIIGGYILLVAATGFVLVRFGRVWDDARSIFLILLLLFVELSLTFDGVLIAQPATGAALVASGLALAMAVSEGLLIGLRIRMPPLFRVPYHLFLALLFLYPLAIVTRLGDDVSAAVWRIYLFSPTAAGVLLTLLPAIRKGPHYVERTGTPWRWPWFPWGLFAFLTLCAGLRAYALSLSFDPVLTQKLDAALQLDSAFGTYFLVPILLAVGLLLLEAGIVAGSRRLQCAALIIPIVCLFLSIPQQAGSAPYADFLHRFIEWSGSPVWLAALAAMAFYAMARLRRVKYAGEAFWGAVLISSCVTRATVDLSGLAPPQAWALWLVAAVEGVVGARRRESRHVFVAIACAIAAYRTDFLSGFDPLIRDVVPVHAAGLAILALGAFFDDAFAQRLRQAGIPLVLAAALIAAVFPPGLPAWLPVWSGPAYLAILVVVTLGYAYLVRSPSYFFSGLANLCLFSGRLFYELAGLLKRLFAWDGAGWFVWGLVWFALAVLISARKAGLAVRFARLIPRADREAHSPPTR